VPPKSLALHAKTGFTFQADFSVSKFCSSVLQSPGCQHQGFASRTYLNVALPAIDFVPN
jgi:hypothetical protein